ncbi:hypothetical protein [Pontibacter burrus]|uniref:Uncharacterized protein n=1 Tax=Pontibacter burrus TaxID=2704466 RepID=A0A6B3LRP1_9BACT|nr:hypothetical protein [Pontibacter burrus]NEM96164.1 hypothetical protein [Pontibacter burrus]
MEQPRILLISNYWEWNFLSVLSLLIRMLTYGPNHAAILVDGKVQELVGSGYKETDFEQWKAMKRRQVKVYEPLVPLVDVPVHGGYGFLDLLQFGLHIVRRKWLLIGHDWNGKDGVRLWPGLFCSEYVGLCLGRKDAHLLAPADLEKLPELRYVETFTT